MKGARNQRMAPSGSRSLNLSVRSLSDGFFNVRQSRRREQLDPNIPFGQTDDLPEVSNTA